MSLFVIEYVVEGAEFAQEMRLGLGKRNILAAAAERGSRHG